MSGDRSPVAAPHPPTEPLLSVVVLGSGGPWQRTRTSLDHQCAPQPVAVPYEVLVDDATSGPAEAGPDTVGGQIGRCVARARGTIILLVAGGAPVLTPRVVDYTVRAFRVSDHAVVRIPDHQLVVPSGDPQDAVAALDHIEWPHDGYRLFHVAVPPAAAPNPPMLRPGQQTRCFAFAREDYDAVGDTFTAVAGAADAVTELGRALDRLPRTRPFVLPGEGAFHQVPGPCREETDRSDEPIPVDPSGGLAGSAAPTVLGAVTGWAIPSLRSDISANLPDPVRP